MPIISVSSDFNFTTTIHSHGWYQLPPFNYDEDARLLKRIVRLNDGSVVKLNICDALHSSGQDIVYFEIEGLEIPSQKQEEEAAHIISRCLCLDWDLSAFYAAMRERPEYRWIEEQYSGRMLISPTVWEDMAKTLLTTNTTWSQTRGMCERLCALGEPYGKNGGYTFPAPERIAAMSLDELAGHIRAGYRSAYLHEMATVIAEGKLDVESWYGGESNSEELYRAVKSLRGFGDYAAGTVLRLLGRFDRIAIDSACRTAYKRLTGSETANNKEIYIHYEPFGKWRGLVMWMDIVRCFSDEI